MYWVRELASWLEIIIHRVLGQSYISCIEGVLEFLEGHVWPWIQDNLEEYLDRREDFYEVLKAQDEGFGVEEEEFNVLD